MESVKLEKNKHLVHLNRGEPIVASLTDFAEEQKITMAKISGIGAVFGVELGCFDMQSKSFKRRWFNKYSELLSASGNISLLDGGEPYVHLHASFADTSFATFGGHLFEAYTAVVCEFFIESMPHNLNRCLNASLNIQQWDLTACQQSQCTVTPSGCLA